MLSQDITLLLYPVISSRGNLVLAPVKHVYNFCKESYYGECVRHFNARIGEHIRIWPMTKKKVKPVSNHLLLCNYPPSFKCFSVLTKEKTKFAIELKESILIMIDKPLIRNRSAPLYLFDRV